MKNKIAVLATAAVLLVGGYQSPAFASDPVTPSKSDKTESMEKPGKGDTTTASPVDPSKVDRPAPAPDARNPVKSNESAPADVKPSKPGAADQTTK